ncbi:MAG TPA: sugar kinase, partial [Deinococcales bacterium]|nr:sugar kinase [Deinococcales bacterium]
MTPPATDCQGGDTRFAVTAFGETMLRYSVPAGNYFVKTGSFDVHVGGSESNVCAAVAQLGHAAGWFSALPDNRLGDMVLYRLNAAGVDTRHVIRKAGSRLGTYYLDAALPPNVSDVIYDRERSAFAELTAADIDVDKVLDTAIFHGTGITAGLGGAPAELLLDLLREARKRGITTTFDVNFRAGLWTAAAAAERLKEFLAEADVVFCSQRDAAALFGAGADAAAA